MGEITLWAHFVLALLLFFMLFIPTSLWPERPAVHFYILVFIMLSDLIAGIFYYLYDHKKHFYLICPLTLLMQRIRGYKFLDKRNYEHSYVIEVGKRFGFKLSRVFARLFFILFFIITLLNYIIYVLQ